jgi:hypothetical protein
MSNASTRITIFSFNNDGVAPVSKIDVLRQIGNLSRLSGEVYISTDGILFVLDEVEEIAENLFSTKDGQIFSLSEQVEEVSEDTDGDENE